MHFKLYFPQTGEAGRGDGTGAGFRWQELLGPPRVYTPFTAVCPTSLRGGTLVCCGVVWWWSPYIHIYTYVGVISEGDGLGMRGELNCISEVGDGAWCGDFSAFRGGGGGGGLQTLHFRTFVSIVFVVRFNYISVRPSHTDHPRHENFTACHCVRICTVRGRSPAVKGPPPTARPFKARPATIRNTGLAAMTVLSLVIVKDPIY